jgi:hypothetical protein
MDRHSYEFIYETQKLKRTNEYTVKSGGGGRLREHEGQPVIEAGVSVYRLGPRCRTQAQMHDLKIFAEE